MLGLEQLKEDPDEIQKKMHAENPDNIKLYPILKEAYDLLAKIESLRTEADKSLAKLNEQRTKLRKKRETIAALTSVEDQAANAKDLFKTIMCPLIKSCPNDTRDRWPKSDIKNITQLGSACPYAHHPMELKFPQTLTTKLSAIKKMQSTIEGQVQSKKA